MLVATRQQRILVARMQSNGHRRVAWRIEMIGLGIVLLVVGGGLWLGGALFAGLFKLVFGLLGGLVGFFAVGFAALLIAPIVLFALLPLWLPVLFVAAIVWLIVRSSRTSPPVVSQPAPHQPQAG